MMHYESGRADRDARQTAGASAEPWLNVLRTHEPGSMPAFDWIVSQPELRARIHGKVLDVAAGSCWLSAKAALLPEVEQVYALDLSERFLRTTGERIVRHFGADPEKVTFVASDFNHIPLEDGSLDCAFLFAAIHHSLSPIKTLQEVGRCLRPGGAILVVESPSSLVHIRRQRRRSLALSEHVTEIAYTREELEYVMAVACVGPVHALPLQAAGGRPVRRMVRHLLRRLGWEDAVLTPPTYLFVIEKS